MPESEIAVIGLGAMGGAALYHLARQGVKAVGFEQYRVGHAWGSSHGHSRVFRIFYEDLLYVNLVEAALPLWQDLEQRCGQSLLTLNGMLIYARPDNIHFAQNLEAVATTQTAHELLTPAEVSRRFPALRLPEEAVACYTPRAGFVDAGGAVKAQVDQARRLGATVYEQAQVQQIDWTGERPELVTTAGRFRCERLIITPGPWAANILADLALPLQVTRQQKFYFRPHNPALYQPDRLPIYADYDRQFYGFPNYGPGLKVADDIPGPVTTPDTVDRTLDPKTETSLKGWLADLMPNLEATTIGGSTCLYTLTPDHDFLIGPHPKQPNLLIGAGFSGHGFKFSILVGKILADLASQGTTPHPIDRFRLDRFGHPLNS